MNEQLYTTLGTIPDIGRFKIYSNEDNWDKVDFLMTYLSQKRKPFLPNKAGILILQKDLSNLSIWGDKNTIDLTYLIENIKITEIPLLAKTKLMKRIMEYEKKGWEFYLQNKTAETFERYLHDFEKGSKNFKEGKTISIKDIFNSINKGETCLN